MSSPLLLLCLGVAIAACGPAAPDAAAPLPDADVSADPPAAAQPPMPLLSQQTSGFTESVELVLRDEAALAEAWRVLHSGLPGNPPPDVDLGARMVVLVALGQRSSGGHDVRVDEVVRRGDEATVRYTATEPGPGCMTTQMMTSPVVAVSVPRVAGEVRFERRTATAAC